MNSAPSCTQHNATLRSPHSSINSLHPLRSRVVRCGGCCLRCVCWSRRGMCVMLSLMRATDDDSGAQVLQRFSPRRKAARLSYSSEPLSHEDSDMQSKKIPNPSRRGDEDPSPSGRSCRLKHHNSPVVMSTHTPQFSKECSRRNGV